MLQRRNKFPWMGVKKAIQDLACLAFQKMAETAGELTLDEKILGLKFWGNYFIGKRARQ